MQSEHTPHSTGAGLPARFVNVWSLDEPIRGSRANPRGREDFFYPTGVDLFVSQKRAPKALRKPAAPKRASHRPALRAQTPMEKRDGYCKRKGARASERQANIE